MTYEVTLPALEKGEYALDLGEVRKTAAVYLDGEKLGEATVPPYIVTFRGKSNNSVLKIVVANTAANECARTDYFDKTDIRDRRSLSR